MLWKSQQPPTLLWVKLPMVWWLFPTVSTSTLNAQVLSKSSKPLLLLTSLVLDNPLTKVLRYLMQSKENSIALVCATVQSSTPSLKSPWALLLRPVSKVSRKLWIRQPQSQDGLELSSSFLLLLAASLASALCFAEKTTLKSPSYIELSHEWNLYFTTLKS